MGAVTSNPHQMQSAPLLAAPGSSRAAFGLARRRSVQGLRCPLSCPHSVFLGWQEMRRQPLAESVSRASCARADPKSPHFCDPGGARAPRKALDSILVPETGRMSPKCVWKKCLYRTGSRAVLGVYSLSRMQCGLSIPAPLTDSLSIPSRGRVPPRQGQVPLG